MGGRRKWIQASQENTQSPSLPPRGDQDLQKNARRNVNQVEEGGEASETGEERVCSQAK